MAPQTRERGGVFTVLVSVYVILTVAALGRSAYQIATKFDQAPVAYTLSAFAAVVYLVATIALIFAAGRQRRIVAIAALVIEALGVIVVGAVSVVNPELFPADTVWSQFGRGYLFIPLVLPFMGLWWLSRSRHS